MIKLSIIILSFNTKNLTLNCIRSLNRQYNKEFKSGDFELIVVDNASADSSVKALEKISYIKLIKNDKNYGFSKGCNIGENNSKGEYVLFLNSDAVVEDKGLLKMLEFFEQNNKIGVLGGRLLNKDGSQQPSCGNFYNLFNSTVMLLGGERIGLVRKKSAKTEKVDWVSGASLMIRKKIFDKLGGFDENLFMYMEDMELCFRVNKSGFQTFFYKDVKIKHQEQGSSNRGFAVVNIYKGLLYFYKKHFRLEYPFIRLLLLFKALLALFVGILSNNQYLKKTYWGALKFAI